MCVKKCRKNWGAVVGVEKETAEWTESSSDGVLLIFVLKKCKYKEQKSWATHNTALDRADG